MSQSSVQLFGEVSNSPHLAPSASAPRLNDPLASHAELRPLLGAFLTHLFPTQALAIVHRGDLYRDIPERGLSRVLIKAICAASFRFSAGADPLHPDGGHLPAQWAREARIAILSEVDRFSETRLATLLVLFHHEYNCGRFASSWMLVGLAVRMAYALRCNIEAEDDTTLPSTPVSHPRPMTWIARETRRRLMWSAFCADRFASAAVPHYTSCESATVLCRLPCNNHNFIHDIPVNSMTLREVMTPELQPRTMPWSEDGMMSRYCRLMAIRDHIHQFVSVEGRTGC